MPIAPVASSPTAPSAELAAETRNLKRKRKPAKAQRRASNRIAAASSDLPLSKTRSGTPHNTADAGARGTSTKGTSTKVVKMKGAAVSEKVTREGKTQKK